MLVLKLDHRLLVPRPDPGALSEDVVHRIGRELSRIDGGLVIVHGVAGSDELTPRSIIGPQAARRGRAAITRLHLALVESLRAARCPAESVDPEDLFVLRDGRVVDFDVEPLRSLLRRRRIALTRGGLLSDRDGGYSSLTSGSVVAHAALALGPERVLWASDVDGVLDPIGRAIAEVDLDSSPSAGITPAATLALARAGIETILFNGNDPARLRAALTGAATGGTRVRAAAGVH